MYGNSKGILDLTYNDFGIPVQYEPFTYHIALAWNSMK